MTTFVISPVLNVKKLDLIVPQEISISLSHEIMNWRDDLIKQFTKPNPPILENNYKISTER